MKSMDEQGEIIKNNMDGGGDWGGIFHFDMRMQVELASRPRVS